MFSITNKTISSAQEDIYQGMNFRPQNQSDYIIQFTKAVMAEQTKGSDDLDTATLPKLDLASSLYETNWSSTIEVYIDPDERKKLFWLWTIPGALLVLLLIVLFYVANWYTDERFPGRVSRIGRNRRHDVEAAEHHELGALNDGANPNRPPNDGANPNRPPNDGANPNRPPNDGANPNRPPNDGANPNRPPNDGANPNRPPNNPVRPNVSANPNRTSKYGANPNRFSKEVREGEPLRPAIKYVRESTNYSETPV